MFLTKGVHQFHLSDGERLEVLAAALALFALSLLVALCLAFSFCPLNRWLLERQAKRRRRRQELALRQHMNFLQSHQITSQQAYYSNYHHQAQRQNQFYVNNKSAPLSSYLGPPPAYEAALRATRLQSLTGSLVLAGGSQAETGQQTGDSPDWLRTVLTNQAHHEHQLAEERQLDLGDYFHPPKEALSHEPGDFFSNGAGQFAFRSKAVQASVPVASGGVQPGGAPAAQAQRPPPVMLRLWVKLIEPSELVQRARGPAGRLEQSPASRQSSSPAGSSQQGIVSLSRQLSIPHLFGSLRTLTAGARAGPPAGQVCAASICDNETAHGAPDESSQTSDQQQQTSSITSSASSASASTLDEPQSCKLAASASCRPGAQKEAPDEQTRDRLRPQSRRNSHPAIRSVTSRVLHMNVASFSYVKDETLISTKKHNQLNFHHFHARTPPPPPPGPTSGGGRRRGRAQEASEAGESRVSQLLVSICDIENLLNSSCLQERACLRLAQNSSVYIKCELLAPKWVGQDAKSAASRLLRNPLKVLTHQESSVSLAGGTHTINFAPTIPAAAIDPTPQAPLQATSLLDGQQADEAETRRAADCEQSQRPESRRKLAVNWRHEPNADGKPIVVFESIPKQVALQQQLAVANCQAAAALAYERDSADSSASSLSMQAGNLAGGAPIDLVQLDSVFVSPILSKSLLAEAHLRLRVYAQCKYVNESCLAELKLPLGPLTRAESRDNLTDAWTQTRQQPRAPEPAPEPAPASVPQQQADLILDRLLANLVTASTGSPLRTLIEQVSAEERASDEAEQQRDSRESGGQSNSFRLASWLGGGASAGESLQRSSSSLGASLNKLDADMRPPDWPTQVTRQARDQAIEQNYCRSLMVSHWLNYLVAPSYECQLLKESRGSLVLGLTYLPTSNRLIFNAHRATIELGHEGGGSPDRQLAKRLRLHSDTSYLLRILMVANQRVLKRKQTACARKPEWDSQEAATFDLVNVNVERPSFVVALVMRNPQALAAADCALAGGAGGSLQSLNTSHHQLGAGLDRPGARNQPGCCQSDPESLRLAGGGGVGGQLSGGPCRPGLETGGRRVRRDLVVGHVVLADELWHELRAQPRKQLIKQFKLL